MFRGLVCRCVRQGICRGWLRTDEEIFPQLFGGRMICRGGGAEGVSSVSILRVLLVCSVALVCVFRRPFRLYLTREPGRIPARSLAFRSRRDESRIVVFVQLSTSAHRQRNCFLVRASPIHARSIEQQIRPLLHVIPFEMSVISISHASVYRVPDADSASLPIPPSLHPVSRAVYPPAC